MAALWCTAPNGTHRPRSRGRDRQVPEVRDQRCQWSPVSSLVSRRSGVDVPLAWRSWCGVGLGEVEHGAGDSARAAAEARQGPVRRTGRRTPAGCGVQRLGHRPGLRLVDRGRDVRVRVQHQQQPALRRRPRLVLQPHPGARRRGGAAVRRRARRPLPEGGGRRRRAERALPHLRDERHPPVAGDTTAAAPVFSRFLRHLAYLELDPSTAPLPEMQWFPPTRAVA